MLAEVVRSLALFGALITGTVIAYSVIWAALLATKSLRVAQRDASTPYRTAHWTITTVDRGLGLLLGHPGRPTPLAKAFRWPAEWPLIRLALLYWVGGITIGILFMPVGTGDWRAKSSTWMLLATHIWIWASILIDGISFNYTRGRIREFLGGMQSMLGSVEPDEATRATALTSCGRALWKDFRVALLCLTLVLFVSNNTYWLAMRADPTQVDGYAQTVFNPNTVMREFGNRAPTEDGLSAEVGARIPGILVTALTCYVPTALWLGSAIFTFLLMLVSTMVSAFRSGLVEGCKDAGRIASAAMSDRGDWARCGALLLGSYLGLLQCLDLWAR